MIMTQSIDLAGLAHRKNSLTLHCKETLIKVTKFPLHTPLLSTQKMPPNPPQLGLGLGSLLTLRNMPSPIFFSGYTGLNKGVPLFKQKLSGHLLAKSHRYIFIFMKDWKNGCL